jgi:hypothetical protein
MIPQRKSPIMAMFQITAPPLIVTRNTIRENAWLEGAKDGDEEYNENKGNYVRSMKPMDSRSLSTCATASGALWSSAAISPAVL